MGHVAIAKFQSVPVKYFLQFVVLRKRSINEPDELCSNVGFDFLVIQWVEPYSILRCLRFWVGGSYGGGLNSSLCVCPLFLNASWYGGAASLKTS